MRLIYITRDAGQATIVDAAGVDVVMVDLEINGKVERQGHLDTVISRHRPKDIELVRSALKTAELMVRVNPIYEGSAIEIDDCIARGAQRLMLPMFTHPDEVQRFLDIVGGRAPVTLLLETPAALARSEWIVEIVGNSVDFHIGLNDLHLGFGLDFMFELMSEDVIANTTRLFRDRSIRFGVGGIARLGQGILPAELILSSLYNCGAQTVFLSRDYRNLFDSASIDQSLISWTEAVKSVRNHFSVQAKKTDATRILDTDMLKKSVRDIVNQRRRLRY